jgi:hypothetical protein
MKIGIQPHLNHSSLCDANIVFLNKKTAKAIGKLIKAR